MLPVPTAQTVDPAADLIIYCPKEEGEEATVAIKVQSRRLATLSTFFDNALRDAAPTEAHDGLPVMRVPETAAVMEYFIAPALNAPVHAKLVNAQTPWNLLVAIWEVSNKYEQYYLRSQASEAIRCTHPQLAQSAAREVIALLLRAELFNDTYLIQVLVKAAEQKAWASLPDDQLGQLSSKTMIRLVKASMAVAANEARLIKEALGGFPASAIQQHSPTNGQSVYCYASNPIMSFHDTKLAVAREKLDKLSSTLV